MGQISAGAGGVAFAPVPGNYSINLTKFKWLLPKVTPSDLNENRTKYYIFNKGKSTNCVS